MADQWDKYFLNIYFGAMFKEPKEGKEKVKNMMCKQNGKHHTERDLVKKK